MESALLLLGGNIGDTASTLARAVELIEQRAGAVAAKSPLLKTPAWGFDSEQEFLNQAIECHTELTAEELLDTLQLIERELGRDREQEREAKNISGERYCSREIDIDIIFYSNHIVQSPRLTIPHPLMAQREFVLEPLNYIAAQRCHPISGKSIEQMLHDIKSI